MVSCALWRLRHPPHAATRNHALLAESCSDTSAQSVLGWSHVHAPMLNAASNGCELTTQVKKMAGSGRRRRMCRQAQAQAQCPAHTLLSPAHLLRVAALVLATCITACAAADVCGCTEGGWQSMSFSCNPHAQHPPRPSSSAVRKAGARTVPARVLATSPISSSTVGERSQRPVLPGHRRWDQLEILAKSGDGVRECTAKSSRP